MLIDAVITWVDGNDSEHKKKVRKFISKELSNSKDIRTKLDQVDEIEFAVKSILKYAKFVRNIYIVTDNQTPVFLKDKEKSSKEFPNVIIVDHKVIFEGNEECLPVFNSISIETLLFKIPSLAEHFIYFNDDFFLKKHTKTTDFFIEGKPIIRGHWSPYYDNIWHKKLKKIFLKIINKKQNTAYKHRKGLQKSAEFLNFDNYFFTEHTPTSIRKSTLDSFFSKNKTLLNSNIKHRFRSPNQFVMHSLANHLEIKNNTFVLKNDYQLVYFQNYKKPFWWIKNKLKRAEKDQNKLFLCMQSLDQCPEEKLIYIKKWLQNKYE